VAKKLGLNPEKGQTLFQARTQPLRDPKGNPVPCEFCLDLRYKGRVGVYQVMPITEEIQRIILSQGTSMDIAQQAQREGVRDLRQSGLIKVRLGVTTLEEIISVTNE